MVKLIITENEAEQRIDRFLKKYLRQAPLSTIYKVIRKDAKLNGKRAKEDTILSRGDELTLYISDELLKKFTKVEKRKTVKRQFKIAYEDKNIIIADKPWGLLTHGDSHEKKNTLINQVCGYLQEKNEYDPSREKTFTPAPVNRLDRNTTGLVIFGKNAEALREFTKYIRQRSHVKKYYMTIVCGHMEEPLIIEDRIERDRGKNISVVSENDGKESITIAKPISFSDGYTVLEIELITGRTHQIRTHLSHEGYPLVGDGKYGDRKINERLKKDMGVTTQLLHAYRLEFNDMEGKFAYLNGNTVKAEIPQSFKNTAKLLGFDIDEQEEPGR